MVSSMVSPKSGFLWQRLTLLRFANAYDMADGRFVQCQYRHHKQLRYYCHGQIAIIGNVASAE
jgi:hypothetical protein